MSTKVNSKHGDVKLRRLIKYEASGLLGTPFPVVLHDAVDEKYCGNCGEVLGHIVPDPKSLIAVVAVLRAANPQKLTGKEIRFLRKSLARKAKDFAGDISLSAEQLSRFENDKQPASEVYEKLVRLTVCLGHLDHTVRLGVDHRTFLTMRICSVRDCEEKLEFHLSMGPAKSGVQQDGDKAKDNNAYQIAS